MKNQFLQLRTFLILSVIFGAAQMAGAQTTYTWNVATAGNNNWNVNGNWNAANYPGFGGSTDTAIFGTTGTSSSSTTVNNIVSASVAISALTYTNTGATYHVTQISSGQTLTVTNVTVGGIIASNTVATPVYMTGGGTLLVNGAGSVNVYNGGSSSASGVLATLDLSSLANFIFTNSSGTIAVASTAGGNYEGGLLNLAGVSNNITASAINVMAGNLSNAGNNSSSIKFGAGTNIINVGTLNIAEYKNSGTVQFNTVTGGLRIRGVNGNSDDTSRANITLGDVNGKTGTSEPVGKLLLAGAGHPVDIKAATVLLGRANAAATTTGTAGIVTFDAGTFDATTINMAVMTTPTSGNVAGTINVTNNATAGTSGTLIVGTGGLSLVNDTSATLTGTGILNINGGTATCSGSIIKSTSANSIGNVTVSSGTLKMASGTTVGTTAIPVDTLTLNNGSIHLSETVGLVGANIVATTVSASGTTTITIDSITNYSGSGTATFPLIAYGATDPFSALSVVLPSGFVGTLSDDAGKVDLVITAGPNTLGPYIGNLTWNGGGGNNNWSTSGNWNGTNIFTGDSLFFDGSARLLNNNDTAAGTLYSNITFNATAGAFVLSGNAVTLATGSGSVVNNSASIQTVDIGLDYSGNVALTGGSSGGTALIIGGGITNASTGSGIVSVTLAGTGILTNLMASSTLIGGGTNLIAMSSAANWTIMDNPSSTPSATLTNWGLNIVGGGTLNFGNAGSQPNLTFGPGGGNADNTLGDSGTAATLNVVNGTFTIGRRLNTVDGNVNVSGGTLNIWNQIQADNGGAANVSTTTVSGNGILDVWNSAGTSVSGTIFLASRGTGTLTISGNGFVQCSTIDLSRVAVAGTKGTVNLNGGTLSLNLVTTASANNVATNGAETATLNFNGGTLKVRSSSSTNFFQQNGTGGNVASNVLMNLIVKSGGAVIDSNGQNITNLLVLQHDSTLGGTPDGGLTKNGGGILSLNVANTYTGGTTIGGGTLALSDSGSIADSPNIIVAGGAAFDVSGLSSAFALGASQTLSNSTSTAVLGGDADASLGTIGLTYASGTPSLSVTNGTLTLASTTVFNVNNTGAVLPHGSYNIISIASAGNVGLVSGTVPSSVAVSGAGVTAGATPSLQISGGALNLVVPDQAPVAASAAYSHPAGQALKIALADLATNWSDPDGDAVSLSSVASPSVNGVMVTNDANYIYYTYTGADTTPDSFTYTVSDGFGGTAVGTVNVTVAGLSGTAPSIGNPGTDPVTHNPTFSGSGIPGYEYGVESETSLSGPWANAGADEASSTVTVRNDGSWSFTNSTPSPGTIFFRLYYPYSATPPN